MKNFIKINLIIKECPEDFAKTGIVLKIWKSSWNTANTSELQVYKY